jgi:hypothetical protein
MTPPKSRLPIRNFSADQGGRHVQRSRAHLVPIHVFGGSFGKFRNDAAQVAIRLAVAATEWLSRASPLPHREPRRPIINCERRERQESGILVFEPSLEPSAPPILFPCTYTIHSSRLRCLRANWRSEYVSSNSPRADHLSRTAPRHGSKWRSMAESHSPIISCFPIPSTLQKPFGRERFIPQLLRRLA